MHQLFMHHLFALELAEQRRHELQAAATRARLVADARRAERISRPTGRRSALARWWRRARSANIQPAAPETVTRPTCFVDLVERFAAHGPAGIEDELAWFVGHARAHGATPVLLSILADAAQPDIARQRAFGRILAELDHPGQSTSQPASDIADAA
jgi:hypothetical protein